MNSVPQSRALASNAIVMAEHLSKSYGKKRVLDDLSFSVEPGDVVGVLGKNGAGKTTLLELMLGFSPTSAGSVRLFGHESMQLPGVAKTRVGFVPQQDELIEQLTARDQLNMIGAFYSKWDNDFLERLGQTWEVDFNQQVRELSVGQRQKLSILAALGHRPDLLLLDEPVASLDPIARRQFLEQIVDIAADGTRAVVFSSHIVSDIERLANKIWILKEGRLCWQGDLDSLKESVVRIHVHGKGPIPSNFQLPNGLSLRCDGSSAQVIVTAWDATAQHALEDHLDVRLEVEALALEEIFLELHR